MPVSAPQPHAPGAFALLQDAVREVVAALEGEVAFGGLVGPGGRVPLLATLGVDADRFAALDPAPGLGLGGRVLAEARPHAVADYATAPTITRDFATPIGAEGLHGMGCVPLIADGALLGLLYVGSRTAGAPGDRLLDAVDRLALVTAARIQERDRAAARADRVRAELERHRRRIDRLAPRAHRDGGRALLAESRTIVAALERLLDELPPTGTALAGAAAPEAPALTAREREVLALLRQGAANRTIAERLVISEATVKGHVGRLKEKLGADSRLQVVVRAAELGVA